MIEFVKSGEVIKTGYPDIRNKKMNWGDTSLRMTFSYEVGNIFTTKRTPVKAYKFIKESLIIELFDRTSGKILPKPSSYFDQFKFDLTYNCFGYCFANSEVLFLDPTLFIIDDYEEVSSEKADLILFKEHNGFGNSDDEIFVYSHAVKKLPTGNVSFKPGINQLVEDIDEKLAIHNYNFNHKVYLRKKDVSE